MKARNYFMPALFAILGAIFTVAVQSDLLESTTQAQPATMTRTATAAATPRMPVSPPRVSLTPEEQANIRVYEIASKSVVNITTSTVQYDRFGLMPIPGEGAGSGSVIDKQGHILTNAHVVKGAKEIEVTLADGSIHPAKMVGSDVIYDLAVLKIDAPAESLDPIRFGRSDSLKVGQRAFLVGNPFGLSGTLTTGIISSLHRSLPSQVDDLEMTSIIQTDAAMNPGNSGGPMLDSSARMIGMNVAIATRTGQNSGIGFAIPVDRIRRFLPDLIEHGKIIRADHGIVSLMETKNGLRLVKLSENGPADRAGLSGFRIVQKRVSNGFGSFIDRVVDRDSADVLVAIDGKPLDSYTDFVEIMDSHRPGDTVILTVRRQDQIEQVQLTLGAA